MAVATDIVIRQKEYAQGCRILTEREPIVVGWRDASGTLRPIEVVEDVLRDRTVSATGGEICTWVNRAMRIAEVAKAWRPSPRESVCVPISWGKAGSNITSVRAHQPLIVGKRKEGQKDYEPVETVERGDRVLALTGADICFVYPRE
jgi:hypothetical protein